MNIIILLILTTLLVVSSCQFQETKTDLNNEDVQMNNSIKKNNSININQEIESLEELKLSVIDVKNNSNINLENNKDDNELVEEFDSECSNFFYNSRYYSIAKWVFNEDENKYVLEEQNYLYRFYDTNVKGTLNEISWSSNINFNSILINTDVNSVYYEGGKSGTINSTSNINHVTMCGYKSVNGEINSNSMPKFSSFGLIAAVLLVTLGFVFLRKN